MEIQMGWAVFELVNPEWRGAQAVLEIQVDGGGGQKKPVPSIVGVWIFSGITHVNLFLFIVWFLGHFCVYLVTDKDYFIIATMKANFDSIYFIRLHIHVMF